MTSAPSPLMAARTASGKVLEASASRRRGRDALVVTIGPQPAGSLREIFANDWYVSVDPDEIRSILARLKAMAQRA